MEEVGLIPSNTGKPGGKRTGQRMTHYIEEGGSDQQAFEKIPDRYRLPFTALDGAVMKALIEGEGLSGLDDDEDDHRAKLRRARIKDRRKVKYSYPGCGINVWGKPGLKVRCNEDDVLLEPQNQKKVLWTGQSTSNFTLKKLHTLPPMRIAKRTGIVLCYPCF